MRIEQHYNLDRLNRNFDQFPHMQPSPKWMQVGFRKALEAAKLSKDPNRSVGASVMDADKRFSDGFNGFPKHIADAEELLKDRDRKRSLMVHAELNALNSARETKDCVMFVTAPCCHVCALEIVNRGIIAVYALAKEEGDFDTYDASFKTATETFRLGGVHYIIKPRSYVIL